MASKFGAFESSPPPAPDVRPAKPHSWSLVAEAEAGGAVALEETAPTTELPCLMLLRCLRSDLDHRNLLEGGRGEARF